MIQCHIENARSFASIPGRLRGMVLDAGTSLVYLHLGPSILVYLF
jgi:hypothetical protein